MKLKKIGSKTIEILTTILEIAGSTYENIHHSRMAVYRSLYNLYGEEWTASKSSQRLNNLAQRGYLEIKNGPDGQSIVFTDKAKLKVLDRIAEQIPENEEFYYFVSFDIPESLKNNRNLFRLAIKKLGFRQVQKSLWVSRKSVGQFVEMASREYKVENYVVYLIAKTTNIDGVIDKMLSNK